MAIDVEMPLVFQRLFKEARYKILYGGRGSGKSWAIATYLVLKAYASYEFILCGREFQVSIAESVKKLLEDVIRKYGLQQYFTSTNTEIKCTINGSRFIFMGLARSPDKIKSTEGITIAWIEEAQTISQMSWDLLVPTIRAEGSQIICSLNPRFVTDVIYETFLHNDVEKRDDAILIEANHNNNPYFPDTLKAEMERDKRINFQRYLHIWEGHPSVSEYTIINKDWFNYYADYDEVLRMCTARIITADTAFKTKQENDESVLQVWGFSSNHHMFLLDMVHGRWDFPKLLEESKSLIRKHSDETYGNQVQRIYIEDKASGQSLVQTLRKEGVNAIPWVPRDYNYPDDKVGKMNTITLPLSDGRMWLPADKNKAWCDRFISQMIEFSSDMSHANDDMCDAACIGVSLLHYNYNV